jgi:hypothetical protein
MGFREARARSPEREAAGPSPQWGRGERPGAWAEQSRPARRRQQTSSDFSVGPLHTAYLVRR